MPYYPERYIYGVWIQSDLIPSFKLILLNNGIEYFQTSTVNSRGDNLFQLWLHFDMAFVQPAHSAIESSDLI